MDRLVGLVIFEFKSARRSREDGGGCLIEFCDLGFIVKTFFFLLEEKDIIYKAKI